MRTIVSQTTIAGCELYDQRYSPGHATPWHRHQLAELCFVSGGSFTEVATNRTMKYPRFGLGFKPADLDHRVLIEAPGARCLVVSVPDSSLPDLELEPRRFGEPKFFDARDLAHLCVEAANELTHQDECTELVLHGLMLELLGRVARVPNEPSFSKPPGWLPRVHDRLCDEWTKRPSLRSLAAEVGVGPAVLVAAFRRAYGCTVGEFLRRLQVHRARMLLATNSHSLAQIAASCGFYDQSHFTKLFVRYVGTTPARYRAQLAAGQSKPGLAG